MCVPQNSKIPVSIQHLEPISPGKGRNSAYERGGDVHRKFWIKPLKETNLGVAQAFFWPLKETKKIYISNIYFYIFSRGTLNETFTAKLMAFCPEHYQNPKFTPLSETTSIATPFICRGPPPPPGLWGYVMGSWQRAFIAFVFTYPSSLATTTKRQLKRQKKIGLMSKATTLLVRHIVWYKFF